VAVRSHLCFRWHFLTSPVSRKRLSFTTCLYYFIRYFPVCVLVYVRYCDAYRSLTPRRSILFVGTELTPAFHFTPHDCFLWQVWQGIGAAATAAALDVVLMLRVYAMYERSRTIFFVLAGGFAVEIACMVAGLVLALPRIEFDEICVVLHVSDSLIIYA
jgi:hypothetical protein